MKKGKLFEASTQRIIKELHPTQTVLGNAKVIGKFSQYPREVDVKLNDPNQYDFIAFECKNHKSPIDIEYVESFITKLEDIGAKKGAMVSNSGFTKSAQRIAEAYGVDLLALINTGDKNIYSRIYAGMVIEDIYIKYFNIELSSSSTKHFSIDPNHYHLMIKAPSGDQGTAYRIFAALWNGKQTPLSIEPGRYVYKFLKEHGIQMLSNEGEWIALDKFVFHYEVRRRYYQGKIEMIDTSGLYNVKEKTYQTKSMTTAKINPTELAKIWQEISEEELKSRAKDFGLRLSVISTLPQDYVGEDEEN